MSGTLVNGLGGSAGFGENFLARNDDSYTSYIDLRSVFGSTGINFFGTSYTGLWLNNNGSVTFANGVSQYTPTAITGATSNPIIAAYWADVDTRYGPVTPTPGGNSTGSDLLWYDLDPTTKTFTATWDDVGYFSYGVNKLNAFQLSITEVNSYGDFDITFRYENVDWTTGGASGGTNGLGGVVSRAGYSSGNGVDYYELPQSGNQDAMLNLDNTSNVGDPGVYVFQVRSGSSTPAISVADATIAEGDGVTPKYVIVPVTLAAASSSTIYVDYATSNGTAVAGQDYIAQSGTLTFTPGVTQQYIFVEIVGDTVVEPDETFQITLSNSFNAPIRDANATITIGNDDGLSVSDVRLNEGTGSTPTNFTFTVNLLTASAAPVTVHYATADGTAVAGQDYTATSGNLTFAPGETSKTVTVLVAADATFEPNETFNLVLSSATGAPLAKAIGVGAILNDDGLIVDDATVVEGTGSTPTTANVRIRLATAAATNVSVHWATEPGTAVSPHDFTASSGDVTIAAGSTSAIIQIPIVADSLVEGAEQFNVRLSNAVGTGIIDDTGVVRILDDDGFTISDAAVGEGASGVTNMVFTVTLGSALATAATVHYATADGTATAGSDYTATSGDLTFAAGEISKTITVAVNGDLVPEADETLTVSLSNAVNAGIVRGAAHGTIYNDDGLSIANATVTEGNSGTRAVNLTVSLSAASTRTVTVAYATQDGTALAGSDYQATSGTLTFAPGETSKQISVLVNGDTIYEGNETFRVVLSAPTNSGIVDGAATVTITNDDARPPDSFQVVGAAIAEGTGTGSTILRFLVRLSAAQTSDVTVNYQTSNGTAIAGSDYTATSGTLTIPAGVLFGFVEVPILRDAVVEANETFNLTLSNPSRGLILANAVAAGTILNDDSTLAIAAASASKAEGQSGSTPFTFTVTSTGAPVVTQTVNWAVSGAAVNAADFVGGVLPSGTLTFAPGESSKSITVNVAGDTSVEANEAFAVTLSSPSAGATITAASANGLIINDDASLAIAATSPSTAEGQSGATPFTFIVTRAGDTTSAISAAWAVTGTGIAPTNAADFVGGALPSGTVSFAAGQTTQTITVNVAGDTAVEATEAFTVTLSSPSVGAVISTATSGGSIVNDDASLAIAATSASKPEGHSGTTPFTFTVTRTGDTTSAVSAAWVVTGTGTAPANAADFVGGVLPSGTVSFAAGQTTQTITVNVAGDTAVEANEAFAVTLSNPSAGATITTATANGSIVNDDASLSIASTSANKAEGQSGTTPFTFTVTRAGDTTSAVSAAWAVTGAGTAPANAADFVGGVQPSGTVSFAAGQTTQTITVNVAGDRAVEATEAFAVTLSSPSTGAVITTATANGLVINDDASLTIAATSANKAEGQSGTTPFTFTVTRAGDTTSAVSAAWAVTGTGAAPANAADFVGGVLPSGTVAFAAGQTTQTITVNVAGDTAVEATEAFAVTLSSPSAGAVISTAAAAGAIVNDDHSATLSIAPVSAKRAEGASGTTPFTFNVTRTGDTTIASSANWAVAGSTITPASAADFVGGVLPTGTVSFAAGETTKAITVNVAGDAVIEGDEGFVVSLSAPSTGSQIGVAAASGLIVNDDLPVDTAGGTRATARDLGTLGTATTNVSDWIGSADAADYFKFTVAQPSKVDVLLSGLSGDADLTLYNATGVVVATSAQAGTANEEIVQTLGAGDFYALVTPFSGDSNYQLSFTATPAPASLSLSSATVSAAEGNSGNSVLTFNVKRTGNTAIASSAAWTVAGSGAAPAVAADFSGGVLPTGTISFAAGETAKTISVQVAGDAVLEANESFTLTLSAPSANTVIQQAQATGVIVNDDTAADAAGSTLATAKDLGALGVTALSAIDWVGSTDTMDIYKFTVSAAHSVTAALSGLAADLDLTLVGASGNFIASSTTTGSAAETITQTLAAGVYYAEVSQFSGASSYRLTVANSWLA